jgi:hypothetical protein
LKNLLISQVEAENGILNELEKFAELIITSADVWKSIFYNNGN